MENIPSPKFANAKKIKLIFGISLKILSEFKEQGWVKSIKLGPSKQSGRLYRTDDVKQVLDRLSTGKKPARNKSVPPEA